MKGFNVHQGVKFHDGSELTSADVKASWDRIVWPPLASGRRGAAGSASLGA